MSERYCIRCRVFAGVLPVTSASLSGGKVSRRNCTQSSDMTNTGTSAVSPFDPFQSSGPQCMRSRWIRRCVRSVQVSCVRFKGNETAYHVYPDGRALCAYIVKDLARSWVSLVDRYALAVCFFGHVEDCCRHKDSWPAFWGK